MAECSTSVSHVVDQDGNFAANVTNKHHRRNFVRLLALFVNQRKIYIQLVGNWRHPSNVNNGKIQLSESLNLHAGRHQNALQAFNASGELM